jgi:DNA-binding NtrC family response regulator
MAERILLVMPDHWQRVLLRAELIERGHDAIGAESPEEALRVAPSDPERGPVNVLVIDQDAAEGTTGALFPALRARHLNARVALLRHPTLPPVTGRWDLVLQRPITVGEVATAIEGLLAGCAPA